MLNQENNLILQSYYTVAFLLELNNNNFLESDYFSKMNFENSIIKQEIKTIRIDNQGSLLMALYAMLVIPRELIKDKYQTEYGLLNQFLSQKLIVKENTYNNSNIDYLKHIRNAVAHARVSFEPEKHVNFADEFKNKKFSADLELTNVGMLMMKLQEIHLIYIKDNQSE